MIALILLDDGFGVSFVFRIVFPAFRINSTYVYECVQKKFREHFFFSRIYYERTVLKEGAGHVVKRISTADEKEKRRLAYA
jgi:hypothetical protein